MRQLFHDLEVMLFDHLAKEVGEMSQQSLVAAKVNLQAPEII